VALNVTSTVGFEVGYSYQIIGAALEGRDNVTVTVINSSTQMTVNSLPRNYSSGSLIGLNPSIFISGLGGYAPLTCAKNSVGLADNGGFLNTVDGFLQFAALDPDFVVNKYALQPFAFHQLWGPGQTYVSAGAYIEDGHILSSPYIGMVIEDTFAVGRLDSGTSTGTGNTTSVMNDTGKTWTVNAFVNKVVVITFGAGAGMIKKIVSNTATAITIHSDYLFEAVPDNTSQYVICDEGYRYFSNGTGAGDAPHWACREGI
jgi:hypothetical protein